MTPPKNLSRWAALVKPEAAYGTYLAPDPATDAVLVVERPDVVTDHADKGERAHASLKRVPKSGRFHTVDLVHEAAGLGAAYAAAPNVASIHQLARMAGYDAVLLEGVWTFTPTPLEAAQSSASIDIYNRMQRYRLAGALAALSISGEFGKIPRWTFATSGISEALQTDAGLPGTLAYVGAQVIDPPKAEGGGGLSIGAFIPKRVGSFEFEDARTLGARKMDNVNPGRHGGWSPGAERPVTLKLVVEAEALATYDPYTLGDLVDGRVLTLPVGGVATKRWKLIADIAQLVDAPEQDEENAAMWELNFELKPTGFGKVDSHRFVLD